MTTEPPCMGFTCAYTPLALISAAGATPHRILPLTMPLEDALDLASKALEKGLPPASLSSAPASTSAQDIAIASLALAMPWHGARMALAWRSLGARMALAWRSHGIGEALAWHSHGIGEALAWHSHGARMALAWRSLGARLALAWHWRGARLALAWRYKR